MKLRMIVIIFASSSFLCCGGEKELWENRFALSILRSISLYRALHDGADPTNWTQLRTVIGDEYLAIKERDFNTLGRDAGFKTSIIEKYVFLPPAVEAPYRPSSRVLMMSSTPFKTLAGEMGRYVIFDSKEELEEGLQRRWWKEEIIQQMITRAGVKIPEPETAPPLKVPEPPELSFRDKAELFVRYHLGLLKGNGGAPREENRPTIWFWMMLGAVCLIGGMGAMLMIRRRRKRA